MGTSLRILSANLLNGAAVPAPFAAMVQTLEADIVSVQEVAPNQAAALRSVRPFGRIDPAYNCRGMGIVARRPVAVRTMGLPDSDGYIAEVHPDEWPGLRTSLEIINVHIAAPHHFPYLRPLRWRRAQLRRLQEYLDHGGYVPRILVGDFNATPLWPVYRRLATRMTDAALAVAQRKGVRPEKTWGWGEDTRKLLRIDHAFVSRITIADFQVVPVSGSDHSAIILDAVVD